MHRVRVILSPVANGYHYDLQAVFTSVENGVILNDQDLQQTAPTCFFFVPELIITNIMMITMQ